GPAVRAHARQEPGEELRQIDAVEVPPPLDPPRRGRDRAAGAELALEQRAGELDAPVALRRERDLAAAEHGLEDAEALERQAALGARLCHRAPHLGGDGYAAVD